MFVRANAHRPVEVVLGHLMVEGIGPGSETMDMARGRDVFLPVEEIRKAWPEAVIVNGHYHEAREFNGVHFPGSLARLTRSDIAHQPGYLTVEIGRLSP